VAGCCCIISLYGEGVSVRKKLTRDPRGVAMKLSFLGISMDFLTCQYKAVPRLNVLILILVVNKSIGKTNSV